MNPATNASPAKTPDSSPLVEFGVERRHPDGSTFIADGYTLSGARAAVEANVGRGWSIGAVRVMQRQPASEWVPVEGEQQ
jgi:hypothetical protein